MSIPLQARSAEPQTETAILYNTATTVSARSASVSTSWDMQRLSSIDEEGNNPNISIWHYDCLGRVTRAVCDGHSCQMYMYGIRKFMYEKRRSDNMSQKMTREELIDLVNKIITMRDLDTNELLSEEEHHALVVKFKRSINHPGGTDLIYYPELVGLPSEPTVDEIVDLAMKGV